MQLTGKQISNKLIVFNTCKEGIQQQGVDVRVKRIFSVHDNSYGYVPKEGKTITPKTHELIAWDDKYELTPGYYELEFEEGCAIPSYCAMYFKTRSSLVRCGAEVLSGQFDGGFHTDNMGAFLKVNIPITIEKGARVAQCIVTETYEVEDDDLYNGQWQGDKQREG